MTSGIFERGEVVESTLRAYFDIGEEMGLAPGVLVGALDYFHHRGLREPYIKFLSTANKDGLYLRWEIDISDDCPVKKHASRDELTRPVELVLPPGIYGTNSVLFLHDPDVNEDWGDVAAVCVNNDTGYSFRNRCLIDRIPDPEMLDPPGGSGTEERTEFFIRRMLELYSGDRKVLAAPEEHMRTGPERTSM